MRSKKYSLARKKSYSKKKSIKRKSIKKSITRKSTYKRKLSKNKSRNRRIKYMGGMSPTKDEAVKQTLLNTLHENYPDFNKNYLKSLIDKWGEYANLNNESSKQKLIEIISLNLDEQRNERVRWTTDQLRIDLDQPGEYGGGLDTASDTKLIELKALFSLIKKPEIQTQITNLIDTPWSKRTKMPIVMPSFNPNLGSNPDIFTQKYDEHGQYSGWTPVITKPIVQYSNAP